MAHLSDLFNKGEVVTITDSDDVEYEVFVRRPAPTQQQAALDAANARMASYTIQYEDKEGERYVAISAAVKVVHDKDELIDQLMMYEESDLKQQAYNEVLYDRDIGSVWADIKNDEEGEEYLEIITAIGTRWEEITRHNADVEDDPIDSEHDDVLQALMAKQGKFQAEVDERAAVLIANARQKHVNKPLAQLQNELIKKGIEVEAKLYWYEEYQVKMLYYACRYPDDHKKLYFDEPYDVLELPQYIRAKLFKAYEEQELGSEDVKNSLSLPTS
jgi:hypothetical protein